MPKKIKAAALAKGVFKRVADPRHLYHAVKLHRGRKESKRVRDDAELALIGRILPGAFLHYGYFDDPSRQPEDISLNDIVRAQARYAQVLIAQMQDRSAPVLDVGCGMGGLLPVLKTNGFSPVALTPDRTQIQYVRNTYPDVPTLHLKFEELAAPDHAEHLGRYGTVVTSESLQYLNLDKSLPLIASLLKPGGRWVACDYFRTHAAQPTPGSNGQAAKPGRVEKSGHHWDDFHARLATGGWRVAHQADITPNVLPTLRCLYMWGSRFGLPVLQFAFGKLRRKQPAIHYLVEDALQELHAALADNLEVVNPDTFARNKKYALLVMERS